MAPVYVSDTNNREMLEYDGASGAIQKWYAYALGPNAVLNQMNVTSGTRTTLVPDILGSIIGSQDSTSGALTKIGYLPYGKSPSTGPFGFTGQRVDPEIGAIDHIGNLYYYRARHYSSAWGRFLQPDPIGYAGGANLYAYVGNDPLNRTDATGNDPVIGALVGLIAGGFYGGLSAYANPGRSFQSVLAGAGAGAVVGAGVGLFDPNLGAGTLAVIGGLAGGAGDLAAQFVTNSYTGKTIGDVNFGSTLGAVAGGAISGAGGSVLGSLAVKAGVSEFAATVFGASISAGPGALLPLVGGALSESNNSASEGQNSAEGAAQPNSLPTSSASAAQVPSK
jgi:RHS repeat-associated protein